MLLLTVFADFISPDDGKVVLTGDTLHVSSCGHTRFSDGCAATLYQSVHGKLYSLPDACVVFPGHEGFERSRTRSTIAAEKSGNLYLPLGVSQEDFVASMEDCEPAAKSSVVNTTVPSNLKDGTKPFFVRSLRNPLKDRWGIFG